MMFSCDRYDKIQRKAFNDINEVGYIKFQTGNMIEKPKLSLLTILWKLLYVWTVLDEKL